MKFNADQLRQVREQMARIKAAEEAAGRPVTDDKYWAQAVRDVAVANNVDPGAAVGANAFQAYDPFDPSNFEFGDAQGALAAQIAATNYGVNQQNQFNRVNESGPFGSATYVQNPDGSYTRQYELSGNQGQINELREQTDIGLGEQAASYLPKLSDAWAQSLNYDSLGAMPTLNYGNLPSANAGDFSSAPGLVDANYQGLTPFREAPQNYDDIAQVRGVDDLDAERRRIEGTLYDKFSEGITEDYDQQLAAQQQYLADIGASPGSPIYRKAMEDWREGRADALGDAKARAVAVGGEELSRNYGIGADARAQAVGERNTLYGLGADARTRAVSERTNLADMARANRGVSTRETLDQYAMRGDARDRAAREAEQSYAAGMGTRNQGISELNQLRRSPFEEFGALLGAQQGVINPSFQGISNINIPQIDAAGIGFGYEQLGQNMDLARMDDATRRWIVQNTPHGPGYDVFALQNLRHQHAMEQGAANFGYETALQGQGGSNYGLGDAAIDIGGAVAGGIGQAVGANLFAKPLAGGSVK